MASGLLRVRHTIAARSALRLGPSVKVSSITGHLSLLGGARHQSTDSNNTVRDPSGNVQGLIFAAVGSALLGFAVAKSSLFPSAPTASPTSGSPAPPEVARKPRYGTPKDFDLAILELQHLFSSHPSKVSVDPEVLYHHGFSTHDRYQGKAHSVVVFPESTEDVVRIVKVANKYKMPVVAYSGATSLEGQFTGYVDGGICVDMSGMDKILAIHEADSDLVCQPGVGWMEINDTLKEKGIPLFFPLDPAPTATIGGMLSNGCSGTNAVRYGTAKAEWFLNVTAVLPSGEVIKTRRRSRKSSAGWDTTKLFIGAEGTLGIITEVTIRLAPLLPTTVAVVPFPSVEEATQAVVEVLNTGAGIQCVELVDDVFMSALNSYGVSSHHRSAQGGYAVRDSLFFKFQGTSKESLAQTAELVKSVVMKHGAESFDLASNDEEAAEIWMDRKNAHFAGLSLRNEPGVVGWPTDVCVPVSNLPRLVKETKDDVRASGLITSIVGHVGDGNFHALILYSLNSPEEIATAKALVHRMVKRALALDGTCTGEHGVGIGKKEYLKEELGAGTVKLMKQIKSTLDPHWLFNPGKLYPDDDEDGELEE